MNLTGFSKFCYNMKRPVFRQSNALDTLYEIITLEHMNSLYYVAAARQWWIGPEAGGRYQRMVSNSTEVCPEALENANWLEYNSGQLKLSETGQLKCLDNIHCACQNLDISGFQNQQNGNGHYIMDNVTFDGRKCFDENNNHCLNKSGFMPRLISSLNRN